MLPGIHVIELIVVVRYFLPNLISFLDDTEIANGATNVLRQTNLIEFSVVGTTNSLALILAFLGIWID